MIVATGTEVSLGSAIQEKLAEEGIAVRLVSMPCTERFDAQDAAYRESVLPAGLPVLTIEAGSTELWYKYTRGNGASPSISSAPRLRLRSSGRSSV